MASQFRRTLFSLVDQSAKSHPANVATRSPFQPGPLETLTYADLRSTSLKLATRLLAVVGAGNHGNAQTQSGIISDLPNTIENLLLQIACSRLGVAYCTVKDENMLKTHQNTENASAVAYKHFVVGESSSWAHGVEAGPASSLVADLFQGLGNESELPETSGSTLMAMSDSTISVAHAFFNSATKPLLSAELQSLGSDAKQTLQLSEQDKVCVSITLCHPFGIGSGVSSVFQAGATLVLPAVGGIRGCGDPKERANACLKMLREEECTVLFSDAPIMKQLGAMMEADGCSNSTTKDSLKKLRGGVVKTGSGSDFLEEKMEFEGVQMWTMGKKA